MAGYPSPTRSPSGVAVSGIALALLLVGCSGAPSSGPADPGSVGEGPVASGVESSAGAEVGAVQQVTPEQREQIAQNLADFAEAWGIKDPPTVDIVRMVPEWEAHRVQGECMREQGWAWNEDGTQGPELTTEAQRESHNLAWYVCQGQFPPNPDQRLDNLTDEQKQLLYEYYAVTLVGCLGEQGETIVDVPSEQTFIERFDQEGPWNPYRQLDLTQARLKELEKACPMTIPGELLWGE